jgi:hypothetical protein
MLGCRAMHPPAGIDAFLVAELGLPTNWIINPVVIGTVLWWGILGSGRWANTACRARASPIVVPTCVSACSRAAAADNLPVTKCPSRLPPPRAQSREAT